MSRDLWGYDNTVARTAGAPADNSFSFNGQTVTTQLGEHPPLKAVWKDFQDWKSQDSVNPESPEDAIEGWYNIEDYMRDRHGVSPYSGDPNKFFNHPVVFALAKLHSLAQDRRDVHGYGMMNDDDMLTGAALGLLKIRQNHTAARIAMPMEDAYDNNWPDNPDAGRHNQDKLPNDIPIHPGPWYHGSGRDLEPGTVLIPGSRPRKLDEGISNRADWNFITNDTATANMFGQHVYEVEPEGEGPFPWNGRSGIFRNHYVTPRARVVRRLDKTEIGELPDDARSTSFYDPFLQYEESRNKPKEAHFMTAAITVYTKPSCVQCTMTRKQLDKLGIEHRVIDVTADPDAHAYVTGLGYQSAPVVVVGDGEQHWAGFSPDKIKGLVDG